MIQITIIASLIMTLAFSSAALKIMGDAEKALPAPTSLSVKTCDTAGLKSDGNGEFKRN